ncbi:hypothetical protein EYF80_018172 [Liparis tanakae]|uniref:Uncharacterized protein n=1 Tax=Liparis tanakae TaxID=230148 RepID=A0A4Z2I114_9TELE|nr:hypothetical protein EYF80_018172 [Liparis tanakae]
MSSQFVLGDPVVWWERAAVGRARRSVGRAGCGPTILFEQRCLFASVQSSLLLNKATVVKSDGMGRGDIESALGVQAGVWMRGGPSYREDILLRDRSSS